MMIQMSTIGCMLLVSSHDYILYKITSVQEFESLITAPVGTSAAARTHAIDPRISIALDIISRVCDDQDTLVQDILREEQGHKV